MRGEKKNMNILMVIPKYNLTKRPNYEYSFPIGLGYIISAIKEAGYNIDCINLNHMYGSIEELVNRKLNEKEYDIVCSGHMGIGYAVIEKIINAAKSHPSKLLVIIGGALITSEPELMTKNLNYNFGVIGEGEITIIELLKCLEEKGNPRKVDGICFRDKNGEVIITPKRKVIENLDSIPFPDFKEMGIEEQFGKVPSGYSLFNYFDYPRTYQILGTRGCPFNCTFCYHILEDKRYRLRSVKNVMEEIRHAIKNYKINHFSLNDDTFAFDRKRLKEFCREIKKVVKEVPWEFKWDCQMPVTYADEETLSMLKDAGCFYVGFGFESYSPTVLKSMKKPITPEQIDRVIKLCFKLKTLIVANFIFGDVAETNETARETLDYWKDNCKGQVKLFFIQPYPGSEIFHHCVKKGIIKNKLDYIKNEIHHTNIMNMTDKMNDEDFKRLIDEVWENTIKHSRYVVPLKMARNDRFRDRIDVTAKCPFCSKVNLYKNISYQNRILYNARVACRNLECSMLFFFASRPYIFTIDHYREFDFLRKSYLHLRDLISKKTV